MAVRGNRRELSSPDFTLNKFLSTVKTRVKYQKSRIVVDLSYMGSFSSGIQSNALIPRYDPNI